MHPAQPPLGGFFRNLSIANSRRCSPSESILAASPIKLCRTFVLPVKSNFATVIARELFFARFIRLGSETVRLTEGPLPTGKRETGLHEVNDLTVYTGLLERPSR